MKAVFDEEKDVEGLSHTWIKRMYHNIRWLDDAKTKKAILPCTPLAVIKVLKICALLKSRSWNTSAHTT
jgi:methylenetetrahydrofolate dehydrogenase (NAD+)